MRIVRFRSALLTSVLLFATTRALAAQAAAVAHSPLTTSAPAPDPARITTPAEAVRTLRNLWAMQDFNTGADVGAALVKRFPSDQRVAAWWAVNLRRTAHGDRADSVATRLDSTGRDPVISALRSYVLAYALAFEQTQRKKHVARLGDAVRQTRDVDLAWMMQQTGRQMYNSDYDKGTALVDSIAMSLGNPPLLRATVLQGRFIGQRFGNKPRDTSITNGLTREMIELVRTQPGDLRMLQVATEMAGYDSRADLQLQYTTMMMARSPRSNVMRSEYWSLLDGVQAMPQADRRALIDADRRYYLAMVDSAPWALSSALSSVKRTHKDSPDIAVLERAIAARAPKSAWNERILSSRVTQWSDSLRFARDTARTGRPDSMVAKQRFIADAETFLNKGWTAEAGLASSMTLSLFFEVLIDSTSSADQMVRIARRMLAGERLNGPPLTMAATTVAKRGVAFRLADSLARRGEELTLASLMSAPSRSVGELAESMDAFKANTFDALGFIAFKEGKLDEADKQFAKGLELSKRNADLYLHIGMLRQAQGRADDAELAWAEGMTVKTRTANPNRKELESLYRKKHGSLDGWTPYVAALEEKERTTRKARILGKKVETAVTIPTLPITNLEGDTLTRDALKGKVTVVNFWGTWCGPCVAEMPELQQFYDKYKNDAGVRVITVSNDEDRETLVKWMRERKYTIPTAWSKPYTNESNISAWPTTWFIGPDGAVKYQMIGNAGLLVEEWSWLVEALRGAVP